MGADINEGIEECNPGEGCPEQVVPCSSHCPPLADELFDGEWQYYNGSDKPTVKTQTNGVNGFGNAFCYDKIPRP